MLSVSIIIPTYNEGKNIGPMLEELFQHVDPSLADVEAIVIDDHSPDGTADVARALATHLPVKVIERPGKLGLGSAVRDGFTASARPIVGVMDGDLSHDPSILNDIFQALANHDLVVASRFLPQSSIEWTTIRRLISKIGVALAQLLAPVTDPLSGYFFIHRSIIEGKQLTTSGYKILFEILVKGNYQTVKEVPFHFRERCENISKLNGREFRLFLRQVFAYAFYKVKNVRNV